MGKTETGKPEQKLLHIKSWLFLQAKLDQYMLELHSHGDSHPVTRHMSLY